jgi:hypothetical protein
MKAWGEDCTEKEGCECRSCMTYNLGYQAGSEDMEVVVEMLENLVKWGRDSEFVWADAEKYVGITRDDVYGERTKMQHYCNAMLRMRRTMKAIAQVMRIELWQLWMDYDNPVGKEPELLEGDIETYLIAGGSTKESLAEGLAKIMDIVEQAKERYRNGD